MARAINRIRERWTRRKNGRLLLAIGFALLFTSAWPPSTAAQETKPQQTYRTPEVETQIKDMERRIRNYRGLHDQVEKTIKKTEAERQTASSSTEKLRLDEELGRRRREEQHYMDVIERSQNEILRLRSLPPPPAAGAPSAREAAIRQAQLIVEGGAMASRTGLRVDPGAFVPVEENIGLAQGFVGGDIQYNFGLRPPGSGPDVAVGFNYRHYFGDGAQRSFNFFAVTGEVRHQARDSFTGTFRFPFTFVPPQATPWFDSVTLTPLVGITHQQDTVTSFQRLAFGTFASENVFEKRFGRTGATVGLNVDAFRDMFVFRVAAGVTTLPSADVHGISSLGLPAEAHVDSQVNFYVGTGIGVRFPPPAPNRNRFGP